MFRCTNTDICRLLDEINELFGSKLCPPSADNVDVLTYGEMISTGKQVIVGVTEDPEYSKCTFKKGEMMGKYPWVWSSEDHIVSPWANTTDVAVLRDFLKV